MVTINEKPKGIISYPPPIDQISSKTIFNDISNTEIKVVMFSEQINYSIGFKIRDNADSKIIFSSYLHFSRKLINNKTLYTFPMNECITKFESYKIDFSEDFDGYTEFLIGNKYESSRKRLGVLTGVFKMFFVSFPILLVIQFIMTFPVKINFFNCQRKLNEIENRIENTSLYFCWILFNENTFSKNTSLYSNICLFLCYLQHFLKPKT